MGQTVMAMEANSKVRGVICAEQKVLEGMTDTHMHCTPSVHYINVVTQH